MTLRGPTWPYSTCILDRTLRVPTRPYVVGPSILRIGVELSGGLLHRRAALSGRSALGALNVHATVSDHAGWTRVGRASVMRALRGALREALRGVLCESCASCMPCMVGILGASVAWVSCDACVARMSRVCRGVQHVSRACDRPNPRLTVRRRVVGSLVDILDRPHRRLALEHAAEHDMLVVEMRGLAARDEELVSWCDVVVVMWWWHGVVV